jgi:hypothetical protein
MRKGISGKRKGQCGYQPKQQRQSQDFSRRIILFQFPAGIFLASIYWLTREIR